MRFVSCDSETESQYANTDLEESMSLPECYQGDLQLQSVCKKLHPWYKMDWSVFFNFSSDETFVADLETPTSAVYKSREKQVLTELEPLFKNQFPSFISLLVIKFRRGSIITDLNLTFGAELPNTEDIKSTIWQANATLNITSVTVMEPTTTTSTTTPITTPTTTTTTPITIAGHTTTTPDTTTTATTTTPDTTTTATTPHPQPHLIHPTTTTSHHNHT
ncbi:exocyst complex component 5-like [Cyprinus carpio]|uniref:Exocyst complex component 5-like n=1 Tax=Cyprinus carpio TaxID=7962 RepID=A0A9Q9Y7Q8_CYPCA|nr:exocyst complex component 5-like [Cyprinus carpio]